MDAEQLYELYETAGRTIFSNRSNRSRLSTLLCGLLQCCRPKYDGKGARGVFRGVLGQRKLGNSGLPVLCTTLDIASGMPRLLSTWHTGDVPLSAATLATTAAPTYFPSAEVALTMADGT